MALQARAAPASSRGGIGGACHSALIFTARSGYRAPAAIGSSSGSPRGARRGPNPVSGVCQASHEAAANTENTRHAPVTVGYWTIRGLGAPLRMMLMYASHSLRCEFFDLKPRQTSSAELAASPFWANFQGDNWFRRRKVELRARNPLINLPYILDGDLLITQSQACLAYLGRKLDLWGDDEVQSIECEQLLSELASLQNKLLTFAYDFQLAQDDVAPAARRLLDGIAVPGPFAVLPKFESYLAMKRRDRSEAGGGGGDSGGGGGEGRCGVSFLVTDHATAPDFHLWELLDQYLLLASYAHYERPLLSDAYPLLAEFHARFAALPGNARYLASPLHTKLPCLNKVALFGATRSGARWALGQEYDWGAPPTDY